MAIVRGPRPADNFAQIHNDALADRRLSYKARGLLAYMLSRPVGWRTSAEALAEESGKERRDAIRTGLRELEQYGYLHRSRSRREDGTWEHHQIVTDQPVTEEPGDSLATSDGLSVPGPGDDLPTRDGLSNDGSAVDSSKKETPKKESSTTTSTTSPPVPPATADTTVTADVEREAFERFWQAYPKKENQNAAKRAWREHVTSGVTAGVLTFEEVVRAAHGMARKVQQEGTEPRYIPLPANWLAQRRWTDEYPPPGPSRPWHRVDD